MRVQLQQEWQRIQVLLQKTEPTASLRRLTFASGAVVSGVLMLRLMPVPGVGATTPKPMEESLWRTTGMVRQSVVDLYRIQRSHQQSTIAPTPTQSSTATKKTSPTKPQPNPSAPSQPLQPAQAAPSPAPPIDTSNVIDDVLEMRVAIARNVSAVTVGSSTPGWGISLDGSGQCDIPVQSSLAVTPTPQGLSFNGCDLTGAVWLEASPGGFVFVEDGWFRGRVLLMNDGGQILAVNYVRLGEYLSSVVGSEMYPHWPLEAFKAQAVAARSYALTHHVRPASDYYDLDNTQRYQAYKGINVETTATQQAIQETAGQFLSYQGGIVESLYAASDQIVQEAHGGQGMSQYGAKDYAVKGYGYEQILGVYYPGTGLSRLVVE
jgi:hypothetical protein